MRQFAILAVALVAACAPTAPEWRPPASPSAEDRAARAATAERSDRLMRLWTEAGTLSGGYGACTYRAMLNALDDGRPWRWGQDRALRECAPAFRAAEDANRRACAAERDRPCELRDDLDAHQGTWRIGLEGIDRARDARLRR